MCQFFSCLYTRDGDVRFCEDDSHTTILSRLGWPDDRPLETRGWVRVEVLPVSEGWGPVCVDETSVPAWWENERVAHEGRVLLVAERVRAAWEAYDAAERLAKEAYDAAERLAKEAYSAAERLAKEAYSAAERLAWRTAQRFAQSRATCPSRRTR